MDPAAEPPYIYWWSDAEAHATVGTSALVLGKPRKAEEHYRDSLARISPSFPRDRLHILTRLAPTRIHLRELDGACRAATEAGTLLRRLGSQHKQTLLAEFRTAAQPYATTTQVKDFDTKFGRPSRSGDVRSVLWRVAFSEVPRHVFVPDIIYDSIKLNDDRSGISFCARTSDRRFAFVTTVDPEVPVALDITIWNPPRR